MLVLTRKVGQSIMIGESIVVTVLEIHGSFVRLGVQAPHEIPVHRKEVRDAIILEELQTEKPKNQEK